MGRKPPVINAAPVKPNNATTTTAKKPPKPTPEQMFTQAVGEFAKIKPTADIYAQPFFQGVTLFVSPGVGSQFFEVMAAGAERAGLTYGRWNRQITISGMSQNYNPADLNNALTRIAGIYGLKLQFAGEPPKPNGEHLQQKIQELVHSLLPAA